MRIVLETADYVAVGFSVPVAKILRPHELERALRIPAVAIDVLSEDFDAEQVLGRVQARPDQAIGEVLLRQGVLAGVGNVFKSEICFVTGINPFCKVALLDAKQIEALIAAARKLVKANVLEDSADTIVTYGGLKRRTTHASDPSENLWVYGRRGEPCRKCGERIQRRMQGQDVRVTYWCPHCQPLADGSQIAV
jgi:endonuclease-8